MYASPASSGVSGKLAPTGEIIADFSIELRCPICNHYTTVKTSEKLSLKSGINGGVGRALCFITDGHSCRFCKRTLQCPPKSKYLRDSFSPSDVQNFLMYAAVRLAEEKGI